MWYVRHPILCCIYTFNVIVIRPFAFFSVPVLDCKKLYSLVLLNFTYNFFCSFNAWSTIRFSTRGCIFHSQCKFHYKTTHPWPVNISGLLRGLYKTLYLYFFLILCVMSVPTSFYNFLLLSILCCSLNLRTWFAFITLYTFKYLLNLFFPHCLIVSKFFSILNSFFFFFWIIFLPSRFFFVCLSLFEFFQLLNSIFNSRLILNSLVVPIPYCGTKKKKKRYCDFLRVCYFN